MASSTGFSSSEVSSGNDALATEYNDLRGDTLSLRQIGVTAGETINGDSSGPQAVYQDKTDNEFYLADANDTSKMKFLGFAITDGTDGGSLTVQFHGIVSGFSSLSEGEKYYLQDTAGSIGTSPGTNEVLVGVAVSTTQLLIMKGRRYSSGVFTKQDTTNETITLGFRPSKIVAWTVAGSTSGGSTTPTNLCYGVWTVADEHVVIWNDDGTSYSIDDPSNLSHSTIIYHVDGASDVEANISSVTNTGFTFNFITNDFGEVTVMWHAEGEL